MSSSGIAALPGQPGNGVQDVIAHLDLTSFPNSTGPRREPGKRSLADYGFTDVEMIPGGAKLYRPDRGWVMTIRVLETHGSSIRICLRDRGLKRANDIRAPSYDTQSALLVHASDQRWWRASQQRGGFATCRNDPPMSA